MKTKIIAPTDGQIYETKIKVDYNIDWAKAISNWKDTWSGSNVRKVSDLYPSGNIKKDVELILVNFKAGGSWDKALAWAKEQGLELTIPRDIFALNKFDFKKELGMDYGYVVATTECTFGGYRRACDVWWFGSDRGADLGWVSNFDDSDDWFAFRKSSDPKKLSFSSDTLSLETWEIKNAQGGYDTFERVGKVWRNKTNGELKITLDK